MNRSAITVLGIIASSIVAPNAYATDYNSGVVTKSPSPEYTDVEFGSGWYLRGDISYNIDGRSDSTQRVVSDVTTNGTVDADYDDVVGARVGFGMYVTPNFRVDLTAEALLRSDFSSLRSASYGGSRTVTTGAGTGNVVFDSTGTVTSTFDPVNVPVGTVTSPINGSEQIAANYSASNFMLAGYFDTPKIGAFTPYVGGGIGAARIEYNESRTLTCNPETLEACGFPAGAAGVETSAVLTTNEEVWKLAYQLSVGTAVALDDRTSLDIGYSYTNYADGGDLNYSDGTAIDADGFEIHQVRLGLRYDLW